MTRHARAAADAANAALFPDEGHTRARAYGVERENPPHPPHPPHAAGCRAQLDALADAVRRLCPDRRDPERFHMDKAEIAHALRVLARRLGSAA